MSEEAAWKSALKAMMNIHFAVYLLGVVVVGFGAGNGFAFLYWHLQVIRRRKQGQILILSRVLILKEVWGNLAYLTAIYFSERNFSPLFNFL